MNIVEYLNSKKKTPEEVCPKLYAGITFLDSFFNNFKDPLRIIAKTSVKDLCLAYFTCVSAKNYDSFILLVNKYEDLFEDENVDLFVILLILCTNKEFVSSFKSGRADKDELKKSIAQMAASYNIPKQAGIKFIFRFIRNIKDINTFITIFQKINFRVDNAAELIAIIYTHDDIRKTHDDYGADGEFDEEKFDKEIMEAEKDIGNIRECCGYFKEVYTNSRRKYADEIRKINGFNNILQKIIDILRKNPSYVKPDVMDSILALEVDDEIKHTILDYIYSLNSKSEREIIKSYDDFVISSRYALKGILKDYGINIYSLSGEEIEALCQMHSLELRGILDFFFKFQIPLPSISSITSYDLNVIQKIASLLQNGILTTSFVARNISILEKDNPDYKMLIANLNLLANSDINIKNYPNSLDILLNDLSYALMLLERYGISINNKTTDISFLNKPMLEAKLDLLLEWGKDITIMANYDDLNDSYEVLYFKLLSSSLGFEYTPDTYSIFMPSDLMPDSDALVPEDLATKFRENVVYSPLPESFNDYVVNQNALSFKGVYISLHRVCKNLSVIDANDQEQVFYAIIYHGHYNLNQINIIKEELAKALNRA